MEHFPAAETSPEVTTNEGSGGSAFGRERLHVGRDEAEGAWRARRGMAASRAVRNAAARGGRPAGRSAPPCASRRSTEDTWYAPPAI